MYFVISKHAGKFLFKCKTLRLQEDGYEILDGPRRTGDGYYESIVLDPEKSRVEITV
jgi:hypothetical protein